MALQATFACNALCYVLEWTITVTLTCGLSSMASRLFHYGKNGVTKSELAGNQQLTLAGVKLAASQQVACSKFARKCVTLHGVKLAASRLCATLQFARKHATLARVQWTPSQQATLSQHAHDCATLARVQLTTSQHFALSKCATLHGVKFAVSQQFATSQFARQYATLLPLGGPGVKLAHSQQMTASRHVRTHATLHGVKLTASQQALQFATSQLAMQQWPAGLQLHTGSLRQASSLVGTPETTRTAPNTATLNDQFWQ